MAALTVSLFLCSIAVCSLFAKKGRKTPHFLRSCGKYLCLVSVFVKHKPFNAFSSDYWQLILLHTF